MKNKVITVNSMGSFYVLEELDYQNKKYILCHNLEDKAEEESIMNLIIFEVVILNDELHLNNVEEEIAKIVTNIMLDKAKQSI